MPISTRIYPPACLTVHELSGNVAFDVFCETIRSFYKETGPTRDVLWDIRNVNWHKVPTNDVLQAIGDAMRVFHVEMQPRQGGKTAVVVSNEAGMSLAVMTQILLDRVKPPLPFKTEVFDDMSAANEWLSPRRGLD